MTLIPTKTLQIVRHFCASPELLSVYTAIGNEENGGYILIYIQSSLVRH